MCVCFCGLCSVLPLTSSFSSFEAGRWKNQLSRFLFFHDYMDTSVCFISFYSFNYDQFVSSKSENVSGKCPGCVVGLVLRLQAPNLIFSLRSCRAARCVDDAWQRSDLAGGGSGRAGVDGTAVVRSPSSRVQAGGGDIGTRFLWESRSFILSQHCFIPPPKTHTHTHRCCKGH